MSDETIPIPELATEWLVAKPWHPFDDFTRDEVLWWATAVARLFYDSTTPSAYLNGLRRGSSPLVRALADTAWGR